MRNSSETLCKTLTFGLLSALLASNAAHAQPAVYSKTLTLTQTTTAPAPGAARHGYYSPANTKYSSVRLSRGGTDVAMESIEIAHEGLRTPSPKPARVAR
jgi:hypothetical protein